MGDQQALEETAKKVWKKRPVRAPMVAEKRKREDWSVTQALPLGPEVKSSLKHCIRKNYTNVVDAVGALNKAPLKVPKIIFKTGYCFVYSKRFQFFYIVYHTD